MREYTEKGFGLLMIFLFGYCQLFQLAGSGAAARPVVSDCSVILGSEGICANAQPHIHQKCKSWLTLRCACLDICELLSALEECRGPHAFTWAGNLNMGFHIRAPCLGLVTPSLEL